MRIELRATLALLLTMALQPLPARAALAAGDLQPSAAARKQKRPPKVVWEEGSVQGTLADGAAIWLAIRGSLAYGVIVTRTQGIRGPLEVLRGSVRRGTLRMRVTEVDETGEEFEIGSLIGKVSKRDVRGRLTIGEERGTFRTYPRTSNPKGIAKLRGGYDGDPEQPISHLLLRRKDAFQARLWLMDADNLLADGVWSRDRGGFLWVLPLNISQETGFYKLIIKTKVPLKLKATLTAGELVLSDPFTEEPIAVLTRE